MFEFGISLNFFNLDTCKAGIHAFGALLNWVCLINLWEKGKEMMGVNWVMFGNWGGCLFTLGFEFGELNIDLHF